MLSGYRGLPSVRIPLMGVVRVCLEHSHFIDQRFRLVGAHLTSHVGGSRCSWRQRRIIERNQKKCPCGVSLVAVHTVEQRGKC